MAKNVDPTTMAKLARRLKVSKATISRALSQPAERCAVAPKTRERIIRAARELSYRPNWRARALSHGKTHTVGFITSGLLPQHEAIPYQILESFSRVLREAGYHLSLVPLEGVRDWRDLIFGGLVDGCAMINDPPAEVVDELVKSPMPAVVMNAAPTVPLPVVTADDLEGGRIIGRHLFELGHRRVAMYVNETAVPHYSQRLRFHGVIDAMTSLAGDDEQIIVQHVRQTHEVAMSRMLEQDELPTAIVCYSHYEAVPLLKELWERGISVPQRVTVVTFNDVFPLDCTVPPVTRVAVPAERIGEKAAESLLRQISDGARPATLPAPVVFDEHLIVRASSGLAADIAS